MRRYIWEDGDLTLSNLWNFMKKLKNVVIQLMGDK